MWGVVLHVGGTSAGESGARRCVHVHVCIVRCMESRGAFKAGRRASFGARRMSLACVLAAALQVARAHATLAV